MLNNVYATVSLDANGVMAEILNAEIRSIFALGCAKVGAIILGAPQVNQTTSMLSRVAKVLEDGPVISLPSQKVHQSTYALELSDANISRILLRGHACNLIRRQLFFPPP